jgi:YD repeat-containing protein
MAAKALDHRTRRWQLKFERRGHSVAESASPQEGEETVRFIVALLLMTDVAMAQVQNRTYQDAIGRNTGRSVTDNVTYYDAMGRTTGRSTTNGNTTTVYDQMGRQTGTIRSR